MRRLLPLMVVFALAACSGPQGEAGGGAGAGASVSPSADGTAAGEGASERLAPLTIADGPLDLRITGTTRLEKGVLLHEITESGGPNRILVLEVDPQADVTFDLIGAGESYPALATVSQMGEGIDAIAAVNGEFFEPPGRPVFQFQSDGVLWQTPLGGAGSFAISEDGTEFSVGRFEPQITVTSSGAGSSLDVTAWNGDAPKGDEIVGFTHIGGTLATAPDGACYLVLGSGGDLGWSDDRKGTVQPWTVTEQRCGGSAPSPQGEFVVLTATSGGAGASALASHAEGDPVEVAISYGLREVLDLAGGEPILVARGEAKTDASCDTDYCGPNPRTAAGYTSDGRLLIVTVDGRQAGVSVGMGLDDLAHLFLQLGAEGAVNLDGGGSTTMWVERRGVVNVPSNPGGAERPVGTALVILRGEDTDVPDSLR